MIASPNPVNEDAHDVNDDKRLATTWLPPNLYITLYTVYGL